MGIKLITGEVRKSLNILFRNGMFVGGQRFAHFQLLKILPEWMFIGLFGFRAFDILMSNIFKRSGRSLQGYPLHIMDDSPGAALFFASACPSGAAVYHLRHRRSVSR